MARRRVACRGCRTEAAPDTPPLHDQLWTIFQNVTNLEISETDRLCSFLCSGCLKNLEVAHQFREKCMQIDVELKLQTTSELLQDDESNRRTEAECGDDDADSLVILDKIPEQNEIGDDDIFVFYIKREQETDVPETDEINEIENNSEDSNFKQELDIEYEINLDERYGRHLEESKADGEHIVELQDCETIVVNSKPKTALEFVKLDYNVTENDLNETQQESINVTQLLKNNKSFSNDIVKLEAVNLNSFSDNNVYFQDFSADDVNLQDGVAYSQEEIVVANAEVPYEIINCDMEGLDLDSFNKQIDERTILQQEDGSFLCDCGESFLEITEYEKHSLTHNRFFCTVCGKGFESREVIEGHMLLHENSDSHIACPYCKKRIRRSFLTIHINVNHSQHRPTCSICKKKFATEHNRKRHMLTHANSKEYECDVCHLKFTQRIALINHRMLHKNMEIFSCNSCFSDFSSGEALRNHLSQGCGVSIFEVQGNETKTIFTCNKCGKTCSTLASLKNHIDLVHSVHHMEILCSECGLVLPTKRELLTHVCPHRQSRPKTVNKYCCDTCGKSCASQAMLTMHERVHTNERPFRCKKCPLAFKTKTHLNTHQLTHTQVKNFTCSHCSKSFALKGNLVVHSRTHTGERPYKCNLCNQAFIDSKYLKKHKNRKHAIEQWS